MQENILELSNFSSIRDDFKAHLVNLTLKAGEVIALVGVSGSGKSTLLEGIGLLNDRIKADTFKFLNFNLNNLDNKTKVLLRKKYFGFMPQNDGLLPFLTVKENIELQIELSEKVPNLLKEVHKASFNDLKDIILDFDMENCLKKYPYELSIGQRQRAVFFKAIAHKPKLLLIDEPTSSLDPENAKKIFITISDLCTKLNIAAVVVTHDLDNVKNLKHFNYRKDKSSLKNSVFMEDLCS